ncbi:MAG: hypothetical protein M3Y13_13745 [Armatimonadota bacterium]|nr:hypothetical protein [Armatimonadota bacterium]
MKKRIKTGLFTLLFFALYPFWIGSIAQDYQQAAEQAQQYDQAKGSTAIYEESLYVNGKDADSHRRRASDYFLELREAGGRLRRVGVSEDFWTSVAQSNMVTGQIWRDKVRLVKDQGQFQETATYPPNQVQALRANLWEWSAIGLLVALALIYSNWYLYQNRYSLSETDSNDANL